MKKDACRIRASGAAIRYTAQDLLRERQRLGIGSVENPRRNEHAQASILVAVGPVRLTPHPLASSRTCRIVALEDFPKSEADPRHYCQKRS
jgi:hypothetical protein